jgi:hypothetical protein
LLASDANNPGCFGCLLILIGLLIFNRFRQF